MGRISRTIALSGRSGEMNRETDIIYLSWTEVFNDVYQI